MAYDLQRKRIWVAGHQGLVGSALVRRLQNEDCEVLTAPRSQVDVSDETAVSTFIRRERPDAIIVAAAKVGGILANDRYPADFLHANLTIETSIIHAAHAHDVNRLLFLGSSCIYPRLAPQPITESSLLTGPLEPTNEWYAIAKIAGIKLAQAYRRQYGRDYVSAMPTNLYGPGDNFDLETSHVVPALMRKAHEAKLRGDPQMVIWGTGDPRREFLHVDDCADALIFLLKAYSEDEHINVGLGEDIRILDLARLIADVVGYEGGIARDLTKVDGTPQKLMSAEKLRRLGWTPSISLDDGLRRTYAWLLNHYSRMDLRSSA